MMNAYGGLLCAKYRDFDGFSEETSGAGAQGISGCRTRLLRVLDPAGKVKMVCRLRRDNAWEKLPLEEGEAYTFMLAGAEGHPRIAKWIANSPWFGLMDMTGSNPLAGLRTRCAELSLAAQLVARGIVAMRNWGLPFHFQGPFLEVDEVESGKDYFLLVPGSAAPGFAGLIFTRVQWNVPAGFSCWKIRVPEKPVTWPAELPPIFECKPPQPSIRLEGFRLEPRSNRFPLQFSPTVQSSHDNLEVFITWQADRVGAVLASGNGGWVLSAQGEGKVRLALRGVVGHAEVAGSLREVEFNDVSQKSPCACTDLLIASNGASLPPCPSARISFQGGTPDPRIPWNPLAFLASDPPMVSVELSAALGDGLEFFVNGNLLRRFPLHPTSLLPANTLGTVQLECRHRGILLDHKGVSLRSNPKVHVRGLSGDEDQPMTVSDTISATVFGGGDQDERVNVGYRVMDGDSTVKKGDIHSPFEGPITYASKANLRANHAYRLEFTVGKQVVARLWFKVRPGAGHNSPGSRRPQGFNSLANAFDNLQLPGSREQGHA